MYTCKKCSMKYIEETQENVELQWPEYSNSDQIVEPANHFHHYSIILRLALLLMLRKR